MKDSPTAKKGFNPRPVAWLHTMHYERGNGSRSVLGFRRESPFGMPGVDHSAEYKVTSEPLYRRKRR